MTVSPNKGASAWALSPGHAGMEGQAIALIEALGMAFDVKRVSPRRPWTWLPGSSWPAPLAALPDGGASLAGPWPDLIVSCGRRAAPYAAHIAARSGGTVRTVHIQDPQSGRGRFDIILAPEHDRLTGTNVIQTLGSLHRVTRARLDAARPAFAAHYAGLPGIRVAVLLGGSNADMLLDAAALGAFGASLAEIAEREGASLMVTGSRRSDPDALEAFRKSIGRVPHHFWDGQGDNPYFGMLGWADAVVVTGDSVNMMCEACATGRPVHIASFKGASAKFERFYRAMIEAGHARFFADQLALFDPAPLCETARAARLVADRLGLPMRLQQVPDDRPALARKRASG